MGSSKNRTVNLKRSEARVPEECLANAVMCYAHGYVPSVEFPTDVFEEDEKVQLAESMLEKIALQHHNSNFQILKKFFG